MSKLNINRNIFIDREELIKFQDFLINSSLSQVFLKNTTRFGIIQSNADLSSDSNFKVDKGTNAGTIKLISDSVALDSDGLIVQKSAEDNISVSSDGNYYYVVVSHKYSNLEEGTLSINSDGQVTGTGTEFSKVIRGQSTEVPTKVKLVSDNNTGVYDIVDYDGDFNMILEGESFVPESGIKYFIVGSIALSETVTEEHKQGLYFYDNCDLRLVQEVVSDTIPGTLTDGKDFVIARVVNNSGTVTVEDKRSDYIWEYFVKGVDDKLTSTNNLSDLSNVDTARRNLEVITEDEVKSLLNVDSTGWKAMTGGSKVDTANFDIKVKRYGNFVNITGTFKVERGNVISDEDIISFISYQTIGDKAAPSTDIYFSVQPFGEKVSNYGMTLYIPKKSISSNTLEIRVGKGRTYFADAQDPRMIIMSFNITYIGG